MAFLICWYIPYTPFHLYRGLVLSLLTMFTRSNHADLRWVLVDRLYLCALKIQYWFAPAWILSKTKSVLGFASFAKFDTTVTESYSNANNWVVQKQIWSLEEESRIPERCEIHLERYCGRDARRVSDLLSTTSPNRSDYRLRLIGCNCKHMLEILEMLQCWHAWTYLASHAHQKSA